MLKCAYQQNLFPSFKMSPVTNTNQLARKFRFISVVLRSSPEHLCLLRRLASANGPHLRTQPVPSRDSVSLAPSEGEKLGMCYLKSSTSNSHTADTPLSSEVPFLQRDIASAKSKI